LLNGKETKERRVQGDKMDTEAREGIVCFSEKEAEENSKRLQQEGYSTKVVHLKDGRYVVYMVGEKWEWKR